jgi:hypothetical protein
MTATDESMDKACQDLLDAFFERYPNDELRDQVGQALAQLLGCETALRGNPGGWAGGIVYAVGSGGCGVPGVMNADLEKAFGARMATIRKRAMQVKQVLGLNAPLAIQGIVPSREFTLRDEANAICAYAFRNGPIEDIHADGRISDPEIKELMINASEHLAKLMAMKQESPKQYDQFIRDYHRKFCLRWER